MKLVVETGAETIELEDASTGEIIGTFRYNPADTNILRRYEDVVKVFSDNPTPKEETEGIEAVRKFEDLVYEQLDYLLGYPVSKDIFRVTGALSPLKDKNEFFFEQILAGIGQLIEQTMETRMEKKLARIAEATKDYTDEDT